MTAFDLPFFSPVMNAAGTLGFDPDPRDLDLSSLGGFITNPVSMHPRTAAAGTRLLTFPGGVLIHSGHPNPGLRKVIGLYGRKWARSRLPVIVHLIAGEPDELFRMVRMLEDTDGVAGLEIGVESGASEDAVSALVQAAVGELPVLVRPALADVVRLGGEAADAGASALTIGPPRGSLPGRDGTLVSGRVYGPAVRPMAMEVLREASICGIPLVCSGGIGSFIEVEETLAAGAAGVQIDLTLWKSVGFRIPAGSSSGPG